MNSVDLKIICLILLKDWDPIGVQEVSAAQDEYDAYASEILRLLHQFKSIEDVKKYLLDIEVQRMGLNPNPLKATHVAKKIYEIFKQR